MAVELPGLIYGRLDFSQFDFKPRQARELLDHIAKHKDQLTIFTFANVYGLFEGHFTGVLSQLKVCPKLEVVDISRNRNVNDSSADVLVDLIVSVPSVREVNLSGTDISKATIDKLRKALPSHRQMTFICGSCNKVDWEELQSLITTESDEKPGIRVRVNEHYFLKPLTPAQLQQRQATQKEVETIQDERTTLGKWVLITSVISIISWGVLAGLSFIPDFGLVDLLKTISIPLGKALSLYVNFDTFMGLAGTAAHLFYPAMVVTSAVIIPSIIIGLCYFFYQYGCKSDSQGHAFSLSNTPTQGSSYLSIKLQTKSPEGTPPNSPRKQSDPTSYARTFSNYGLNNPGAQPGNPVHDDKATVQMQGSGAPGVVPGAGPG